ncbi:MAG: lamin tail domain-containing protein [Bacteroidia bacterium]|nr:lamin tail domain-containing protein [Bacteroidia bacterium]
MKTNRTAVFTALLCTLFTSLHAQDTLVYENFNTPRLRGVWMGDTQLFDYSSHYLRSASNSANHRFSMMTKIKGQSDMEWSFDVQLHFNTSSVNYLDLVLTSDSEQVSGNGVVVRIGGVKDDIRLLHRESDTWQVLVDGPDGMTHHFEGRITVTLRENRHWTLHVDQRHDGVYDLMEGATHHLKEEVKSTGLAIQQSSASFHRKHLIDNMYVGSIRVDSLAPQLAHVEVVSETQLQLVFDEVLNANGTRLATFSLDKNTINTLVVDSVVVDLDLNESLKEGVQSLVISNLCDIHQNCTDTVVDLHYQKPWRPSRWEVRISEIMADPSPVVGLPDKEYVEIINTTDSLVQLGGWSISDPGKMAYLDSLELKPNQSVIIIDRKDVMDWADITSVVTTSSMITLNNGGDNLVLKNEYQEVIDVLDYQKSWHGTQWKQEGGWSLELIDESLRCHTGSNWNSTADLRGGSPGEQNSVRGSSNDEEPPKLLNSYVSGWNTVHLEFDESLNGYQGMVEDFELNGQHPNSVNQPEENVLALGFFEKIETSRIYNLIYRNVRDCHGNAVLEEHVPVAIAETPAPGDLRINEVLFDPVAGVSDFVELVNVSGKVIDVSQLYLATRGEHVNTWKEKVPVQDKPGIWKSGEYLLLTLNPSSVRLHYPKSFNSRFIEMRVPGLPQEEGDVYVLNRSGQIIDSFHYHRNMHFGLLDDTKGVSLERRSFEWPSNDSSNWASASYAENYGTPGYQNSQFIELVDGVDVEVLPDPFLPNGDGKDDVLQIYYSRLTPNTNVHVRIFDRLGRLVAFPVNTALAGEKNIFLWDGITQHGNLVEPGVYVVLIETLDLEGNHRRYKKGFTVAR